MTLAEEELLQLQVDFKAKYPYIYLTDPPPVEPVEYPQFQEEHVNSLLEANLLTIPSYCRRWKDIVYALTIHSLLQEELEKQKYQSGDTAIEKDIQSVKALGDLSTTYQKPTSYEKFNPLYDTDSWGQKAKLLLKECAKSRIGIIV
jgi:hypothetical protein